MSTPSNHGDLRIAVIFLLTGRPGGVANKNLDIFENINKNLVYMG